MDGYSTIAFMISFTVALSTNCDQGWRFSPHSQKCFKFFPSPAGWSEAEFHCRMLSSNQLSIHSESENRFVREIAHSVPEIWIGSAQFGKSGQFEWSDGTSFNFRGWKNGLPPVDKILEPCTKMNVTNGEWFQFCCGEVAPYVCHKDPQLLIADDNNVQSDFDYLSD